ncbi:MAG: hypothetical protein ACHP79_01385, partial [Terriglobales bacterium]
GHAKTQRKRAGQEYGFGFVDHEFSSLVAAPWLGTERQDSQPEEEQAHAIVMLAISSIHESCEENRR